MEDVRCECHKIVCQLDGNAVVIKCRHCKRLIRINLNDLQAVSPGDNGKKKQKSAQARTSNRDCWEFKGCGREPGGKNSEELGVCLAAIKNQRETIGGKTTERNCWTIAGTFCGGTDVKGTSAQKLGSCLKCDYYQFVNTANKELVALF